jgi:glycosyltransferase involved in cell wall biosynthesis
LTSIPPCAGDTRVLHLIESGGVYGAEKVVLSLSREMRQRGEFTPVVGCILQRSGEQSQLLDVAAEAGIEVLPLVIPNHLAPVAVPIAGLALRRRGIRVIHSHGYKPSVYAPILGWFSRARIMATCHLWYLDDGAPLKMRLMIGLEKRFYRRFPCIVAVSGAIRNILVGAGVPCERVHVIRNGIEMPAANAESPEPGDNGRIRLLNIGRLTEQKAQADLITACQIIIREKLLEEIGCTIAGEGELRPLLETQIVEAGLADRVGLPGYQDDVASLFRDADVFVLPSVSEGMPVSLLEAVAAGVPVIVTAVGDIPDLIKDGVSGLVVPVHDVDALLRAIVRLGRDPVLRSRLASEARMRLERDYSCDQMYERYSALYRQLCAR